MYEKNRTQGQDFEQFCFGTAVHLYKKCENTTGTEMDKREGTDTRIGRTRVDWTVNPDKDHVEWLFTRCFVSSSDNILEKGWVSAGVRTGNDRGPFKIPVLVILMEYDEELISYPRAKAAFGSQLKEIYHACHKAYRIWVKQHGLTDVVYPKLA